MPGPALAPEKPVYTAVFERDDNGEWFVKAPEVQGAHSHGRTLARARSNLREAISLVLDTNETSFEVEDVINLPGPIRSTVARARQARAKAEEALAKSTAATKEAVQALSGPPLELSLRDVADMLGVSFQRVQQLRETSPEH